MSQTPFIFCRGIYTAKESDGHVESYCQCLRNLKGKTKTAMFYVRLHYTGTDFFPQLKQVADECGITLIPGIEASSYLLPEEHDSYAVNVNSAHPINVWGRLWWVNRWRSMAAELRKWCDDFGTSYAAIFMEEAIIKNFYAASPMNSNSINWNIVGSCMKEIYKQKIVPLFDLPVIWGDRQADCETFITTIRNAFRPLGFLPHRSFWMSSYAFGNIEANTPLMAKHLQLVGDSRYHVRTFSCVNKQHYFERNVDETKTIILVGTQPPVVVYAKFDDVEDGTALCEAL